MASCSHCGHPRGCPACSRQKGKIGCQQWASKYRKQADSGDFLCTWRGDLKDEHYEQALQQSTAPDVVTFTRAVICDSEVHDDPAELISALRDKIFLLEVKACELEEAAKKVEELEFLVESMDKKVTYLLNTVARWQ